MQGFSNYEILEWVHPADLTIWWFLLEEKKSFESQNWENIVGFDFDFTILIFEHGSPVGSSTERTCSWGLWVHDGMVYGTPGNKSK